MHYVTDLFAFIMANWDTFAVLIGAIVTLIRATQWGKANARALQVVAGVVEALSAKDVPAGAPNDAQTVKQIVAAKERKLPPAVADALRDAVDVVDPNKTPATPLQKMVREIFRKPGA